MSSTAGIVDLLFGYFKLEENYKPMGFVPPRMEKAGWDHLSYKSRSGSSNLCQTHQRIREVLISYCNKIRTLILSSEALSLGKIKTKTITGKHLLLAFIQLKFFEHFC